MNDWSMRLPSDEEAAQAILGEPPQPEGMAESAGPHLIVISAPTKSALRSISARLANHLKKPGPAAPELAAVAYTTQVGQPADRHRGFFLSSTVREAVDALEGRPPERLREAVCDAEAAEIAFLFPGLGDHYLGMGRELYATELEYRKWIDYSCSYLLRWHGLDLRPWLLSAIESTPPAETGMGIFGALRREREQANAAWQPLNETAVWQPAVFVVEYALAQLLKSWGIRPCAMLGHSLGEYTAACISGVLSLDDALRVTALRAQWVQALPRGGMLAVQLGEQDVAYYLRDGVSVGVVNSPFATVLSGPSMVIEQIRRELKDAGIACRLLETMHAFHSGMMTPLVERMRELMSSVSLNEPQLPYISNVTGRWVDENEVRDPEYWVNHLRGTVKFADGVATLLTAHRGPTLEVGPGQSLSSFVKQHPDCATERFARILPVMKSAWESTPELETLLMAVGNLWLSGVAVDWDGFWAHRPRRRVPLPTDPLEREPEINQPAGFSAPPVLRNVNREQRCLRLRRLRRADWRER